MSSGSLRQLLLTVVNSAYAGQTHKEALVHAAGWEQLGTRLREARVGRERSRVSSGYSVRTAGRGGTASPRGAALALGYRPLEEGFGDGIVLSPPWSLLFWSIFRQRVLGQQRPGWSSTAVLRLCNNWAGISLARSSAKPSGTINDGQRQDLQPRPLRSRRCVAGVEHGGLLASALRGAVGRGRPSLGFGSSIPLERVLAELHAPGVAGRRDGGHGGHLWGNLSPNWALLGLPVPKPSSDASQHGKGTGTCGDGWAGEPGPRAGGDKREAQRWLWKPGDFSPNGCSENSCRWKKICRTWERGRGAG